MSFFDPVHVERRRHDRTAVEERPGVADLERVQRLLLQVLVADDVDGQEVRERTPSGAQVERLGDDQVDVVVDDRGRAVGAVVATRGPCDSASGLIMNVVRGENTKSSM